MAVQQHVDYVVSKTNLPRSLLEQVAVVATVRSCGGFAKSRVKALVSDPESGIVHNPQAVALYRMTRSTYNPELAESIPLSFLEGCTPEGYKRLMLSMLHCIPKWKENTDKVLEVVAKMAED